MRAGRISIYPHGMSWIDDFFDEPEAERPAGEICTDCFMEKPVSGIHNCEEDR